MHRRAGRGAGRGRDRHDQSARRARGHGQRLGVAAALAAAASAACGGAPFDEAALRAHFPELAAIEGQRLADVTPYVLPSQGVVTLFLCRIETELPVLVSLPVDAEPHEARALRAALAAWQGAGLGVRFAEVPRDRATIEIELVGAPPALEGEVRARDGTRPAGAAAGVAFADCRVGAEPPPASSAPVLDAAVVHAVVRLARRKPPDWRGEVAGPTLEELSGAALHELGHALGFQGHARRGDSALTRDHERLRTLGRRVLDGEPFSDPTLRALYALPSGLVLRRVTVSAWRTDLVDRMARLAQREGVEGPFVRVGDAFGRVFWRDRRGREYGLQIPELPRVARDPGDVVALPEARTRRALPRSRDRLPD